MVCTIGLTCPYLLEINNKERYQVAFSDGKRHSLRNLSRWLCECCGSLPSEESELGNCVIVSPLREGHLGRAASIAAGKRLLSASHPRKSSLSVLALSTQPWAEGNGGEAVSLVWGWSLMVAKMDFVPYKGRASLGPNSNGQNHS